MSNTVVEEKKLDETTIISMSEPLKTMIEDSVPVNQHDGYLVGSPEIFTQTPRVKKAPPAVNTPVAVPSVYIDSRGEIHNLQVGDKRVNLLYTKAGTMRSGDIHRHTQHNFIFEGQVKVWTLNSKGVTESKIFGKNQYVVIPPYTPHIFTFYEDTVMSEWWDGEFEAWFYEPYRAIVDKNKEQADGSHSGRKGQLSHYVLMKQNWNAVFSSVVENGNVLWLSTGLALGVSLGYAFGTVTFK